MLVLKGIMEIEQLLVVQLVHDTNLCLHRVLVRRIRSVDEFCDKVSSGRFLHASVHNAEGASEMYSRERCYS